MSLRSLLHSGCLAAGCAALPAVLLPPEAQEGRPESGPAPPPVEAERCEGCHSGAASDVGAGAHARMERRCSGCHGGDPSAFEERKAHLGKFRAVPLASCSACHEAEAEAFARGPHGVAFETKAIRGCVECHAPHATTRPGHALLRAACLACHERNAPEIVEAGRATADALEAAEAALRASARSLDEAEGRALLVGPDRERLEAARLALREILPRQHEMDLEPFRAEAAKAGAAAEEVSRRAASLLERAARRRRWAWLVGALVLANAAAILWRRRALARTIQAP